MTDLGSDSAPAILRAMDLARRWVTAPELAMDLARVTLLVKVMVLEKAFEMAMEKRTVWVFPVDWHCCKYFSQPMIVR